ncbi:hypothetical protein UlMin_042325 [Ulmus minor]
MDKYLVPLKPSNENPKPIQSLIELNGRIDPKYRHSVSSLLAQSYSQIGAFPHLYQIDGVPCQTHVNRSVHGMYDDIQAPFRKQGISALDFDNKGIYLVSVTKSGCLTVHDFETLYCQSNSLPSTEEDATKLVLHLSLRQQLDFVRWNHANQDEVVCTSMKSNEVLIFDIGYISSKPSQVLRTRQTISLHGSNVHKGLSDIAFTSIDNSRLLASDTHGVINVWDRRMSSLPCLEFTSNSRSTLNRIHNIRLTFFLFIQICQSPLTSFKLASLIEKITPLKEQSDIVAKEIHSIDLNPSCPYQLAFHLDDGWSGVLDLYNFQVTHIHCPPPAWLNESTDSSDPLCLRKPSWLPTDSIYVVVSSYDNGIHLLDFYPDSSSPSHVDFKDNADSLSGENNQNKQNIFVPSSEGITACAAHPLNGTIIAGTKNSSLLMIFQRHQSC